MTVVEAFVLTFPVFCLSSVGQMRANFFILVIHVTRFKTICLRDTLFVNCQFWMFLLGWGLFLVSPLFVRDLWGHILVALSEFWFAVSMCPF